MSMLASTETLGTCPQCHSLVSLQIELHTDTVEYHGVCEKHGAFVRTEGRVDATDMGVTFSSGVGGGRKSA